MPIVFDDVARQVSSPKKGRIVFDDVENPRTPIAAKSTAYDPVLPNKAATEQKIENRPDMLTDFVKSLVKKRDPIHAAVRAGTYGPAADALKLAGGVYQKAEAGVANTFLDAQEGKTQEPVDKYDPLRQGIRAGTYGPAADFIKGATSGDNAQLGDVIRNTGVGGKYNEPIAAATGLAAAIPIAEGTAKLTEGLASLGNKAKPVGQVIRNGLEKSVRKYVSGNRTMPQVDKYFKSGENVVLDIVKNKGSLQLLDDAGETVSGQLPESVAEFGDAITQGKRRVFQQYNALKEQAGEAGVQINTGSVVSELRDLATKKEIKAGFPDLAKQANKIADSLEEAGTFTADEAQNMITMFNSLDKLKKFYRDASHTDVSNAMLEHMVANNLRKGLDDAIMNVTGESYQALKSLYGDYLAIERDVVRRAIVSGRQNTKSLVDFSDILSARELMHGLMKITKSTKEAGGNILTAGVMHGLKMYYKHINSPNSIIKNMFKVVDKSIKQ